MPNTVRREEPRGALTAADLSEIDEKYPLSQNPIKRSLSIAIVERTARLTALASGPPASSPERVYSALPEMVTLSKEIEELGKWMEIPPKSDTERLHRISQVLNTLLESGMPHREIVEELNVLQANVRGRRPTKRRVAIDALELWVLNPHKSWTHVTREVCNCGKPQHDHDCKEQLRQQINDLRVCLKKYGITEPARKHSPTP